MFYLTTHSTHFIYGYMMSDIWLRTILIMRKETRCRHIRYSFRLTTRVLLYAPSHRQNSTCHGLFGYLAGTRNSFMGPPHEGSIYVHAYIHAYIQKNIHNTYIHTYIQTYKQYRYIVIHRYIYTYINRHTDRHIYIWDGSIDLS